MIKTREQQIRAEVQTLTAVDPRIDSPDVQVIYPSAVEQQTRETLKKGMADRVIEPAEPPKGQPQEEPQEQPVEKKEEHLCKVDIQEAVKQNLLGFIVLVVLSLGIGYLIGKK